MSTKSAEVDGTDVAKCLRGALQADDPSELLRAARKMAGWSQAELARRVGYDDADLGKVVVDRWETGQWPLADDDRRSLRGVIGELEEGGRRG